MQGTMCWTSKNSTVVLSTNRDKGKGVQYCRRAELSLGLGRGWLARYSIAKRDRTSASAVLCVGKAGVGSTRARSYIV